jgi:hypothetical protein
MPVFMLNCRAVPPEVPMMAEHACPAAYIRGGQDDQVALARLRDAVAEGSRQRGWPPPVVYTEDDADLAGGRAPELARLAAAIEAGRHDALLITEPGAVFGTAGHLMDLLARCTRNGVTVGFLLPPAPAGPPVMQPAAAEPPARPAVLDAREDWAVLARARAEALSGLFPAWRIWLDQAGWHARRRQASYLQLCRKGAPAYSVHADSPTALAAQLCWQQAADEHAPNGCLARP